MSIIFSDQNGWILTHNGYVDKFYEHVLDGENIKRYKQKSLLFKIVCPFKKHSKNSSLKRKAVDLMKEIPFDDSLKSDVLFVEKAFGELRKRVDSEKLWWIRDDDDDASNSDSNNSEAVTLSNFVYNESANAADLNVRGINSSDATLKLIEGNKYLFPKNCRFYSKDVQEMDNHFLDENFDLILLDPPWWNKYIRRKKAKTNHGYKMMYASNLGSIPVKRLIKKDSLIVVWCTNSSQHIKILIENIFSQWDVKFICKWYWLKVTLSGEPVCDFSEPPGKQPFEQIIIGCHKDTKNVRLPADKKLVISVPSALHSNKPPLTELLKPYLPEQPKCLEVFARYLLEDWTSYGLEVLRFQHVSLYEEQR